MAAGANLRGSGPRGAKRAAAPHPKKETTPTGAVSEYLIIVFFTAL